MHSDITFNTAWLTAALLLSLRLGAVFLMTPILPSGSIPGLVRVLLLLALSAVLCGNLLNAQTYASMKSLEAPGALIRAGLLELGLGITLAVAIHLAFAVFAVAGEMLGVQIGFGLGQVIDPASNTSVPLLTSAFQQLAVLLFFLVNGHHALLRGLAFSLERIPLGQAWSLQGAFIPILRQVSGMFMLGFAVAAPVALAILLVDVALGVLTRHLPQMNMLAVGIPLKVLVGVLALSIWSARMGPVMTRAFDALFRTWDAVLQASVDPLSLQARHG